MCETCKAGAECVLHPTWLLDEAAVMDVILWRAGRAMVFV
jgi:hypothetical protein